MVTKKTSALLLIAALIVSSAVCGWADEINHCVNGPVCSYTDEMAFVRDLNAMGYPTIQESFENGLIWGPSRAPRSVGSVTSMGIIWTSNHPDAITWDANIRTGSGPARTGSWALYAWPHGDPDADGSPAECDVDNPPAGCITHDGLIGVSASGMATLYGAGGWITGTFGGQIIIYLDGNEATPVDFAGMGMLAGSGHQFFGVIDMRGFSRFEFRETEGTRSDEKLIFGDDFTIARSVYSSTTSVPSSTSTTAGDTTTTTAGTQTTTSTDATPCIAETIYGEHSEETALMRRIRDAMLSRTPQGRELITLYYQWSPYLAKAGENDEQFKEELKRMVDDLLAAVREDMDGTPEYR